MRSPEKSIHRSSRFTHYAFCEENISMPYFFPISEERRRLFHRRRQMVATTLSFLFFTVSCGFAQSGREKPVPPATKKKPVVREELTLINGDRLTGELMNSTGKEIKFKTDLAGEVTIAWKDVKQLTSDREFAIIPANVKSAKNNPRVLEGAIRIGDRGIIVYPTPVPTATTESKSTKPETNVGASPARATVARKIPTSSIAYVVDDTTYQKEIHRKIGWTSGWDGNITAGSTMVFATQSSKLFQASGALKRTDPSVPWLNPKLRTTINFALSAGKATQPDAPKTVTNIYHVDAEQDQYFSPRGYALQMASLDHNFSQGLVLQQNYGAGAGATLFKQKNSEFDVTIDLHYENQEFNATADVSHLNLHLVGSSVTEAYSHDWGKIHFDEKLLADTAFNNVSAFSASGTSSVIMPVYKNLGFAVSAIDNLLNNPQVGFKKNSFQFSTGLSLSLR